MLAEEDGVGVMQMIAAEIAAVQGVLAEVFAE